MPDVPMLSFLAFVFVLVAGAIYKIVQTRRQDAAKERAYAERLPAAPLMPTVGLDATSLDSTPPGEPTPAPTPPKRLKPREQRDVDNRARQKEKLCRFCDEPATEQLPALVPVNSLFDGILRRIGARMPKRVYLVLRRDPTVHPDVLCTEHHEAARVRVERFLTDRDSAYMAYLEAQESQRFEYQRYGLDEAMKEESESVKNGTKKAPNAPILGIVRPTGT